MLVPWAGKGGEGGFHHLKGELSLWALLSKSVQWRAGKPVWRCADSGHREVRKVSRDSDRQAGFCPKSPWEAQVRQQGWEGVERNSGVQDSPI